MRIADRLRTLRLDAGLSQEELAAKAHVSLRTVARLEGGGQPNRSTLHLLATALGVTVAHLKGEDANGEAA